ncbi:hypothetical protein DIPPA_28973 [Diplonema papillatum]|nr:hypothetical protein DIPPA_28973 [Diplonema papillatum]
MDNEVVDAIADGLLKLAGPEWGEDDADAEVRALAYPEEKVEAKGEMPQLVARIAQRLRELDASVRKKRDWDTVAVKAYIALLEDSVSVLYALWFELELNTPGLRTKLSFIESEVQFLLSSIPTTANTSQTEPSGADVIEVDESTYLREAAYFAAHGLPPADQTAPVVSNGLVFCSTDGKFKPNRELFERIVSRDARMVGLDLGKGYSAAIFEKVEHAERMLFRTTPAHPLAKRGREVDGDTDADASRGWYIVVALNNVFVRMATTKDRLHAYTVLFTDFQQQATSASPTEPDTGARGEIISFKAPIRYHHAPDTTEPLPTPRLSPPVPAGETTFSAPMRYHHVAQAEPKRASAQPSASDAPASLLLPPQDVQSCDPEASLDAAARGGERQGADQHQPQKVDVAAAGKRRMPGKGRVSPPPPGKKQAVADARPNSQWDKWKRIQQEWDDEPEQNPQKRRRY